MSALDLSKLSPADAVAALRSYPRRYRSMLAPLSDDEDVEEIVQRAGPEGRSALEIASDTVRTWTVLAEALRRITITDEPVVHAAVVDPSQRDWQAPPEPLDVVLDLLDEGAEDLATAAERLSGREWNRAARVAGGATVTALEVVKEAVRVGHDNLAEIDSVLASLRTT